ITCGSGRELALPGRAFGSRHGIGFTRTQHDEWALLLRACAGLGLALARRNDLTPFNIGQLSRVMRNVRPSLVAVATMAPVSLLALHLWSTTPSVLSPHGLDPHGGATLARPVVFLAAW